MPYREEPLEATFVPPAYPQPDWKSAGCTAVKVFIPSGDVGYLVLAKDALQWVPVAAPGSLASSLSQHIREEVSDHAGRGTPAASAWAMLLPQVMHTTPIETSCQDVLDRAYGS